LGPSKRDKIAGYWRRLANEELHDLNCLPSIIWVIKPRIIDVRHMACLG